MNHIKAKAQEALDRAKRIPYNPKTVYTLGGRNVPESKTYKDEYRRWNLTPGNHPKCFECRDTLYNNCAMTKVGKPKTLCFNCYVLLELTAPLQQQHLFVGNHE